MSRPLSPEVKLYRVERDRAKKRRRAELAPIMRAAKKELEAQIAAMRPRRGRPPKKGDRPHPFRITPRDPLDL